MFFIMYGTFFLLLKFIFVCYCQAETNEGSCSVCRQSQESNYSCIVPLHLLISHLYLHIELML